MFDTGIRSKLNCVTTGVEETRCVMRRGKNNESTILLEDFNAHVRNDAGVRKGVISQRGDTTVNGNRRQL